MSNEETLRKLALQVRNWGKWGSEDEIGTLNYITPEEIAQASRLVTAGKVFALGIPLQRNGPQSGTRQRFNPIHSMFRDGGDQPKTHEEVIALQGYGGSDDWIVMPLHASRSRTAWRMFLILGRCTTATTPPWSPAAVPPKQYRQNQK